jgi:hypothetical protein
MSPHRHVYKSKIQNKSQFNNLNNDDVANSS